MHGTVWWMETLSLTVADLETKNFIKETEITTRFISQCSLSMTLQYFVVGVDAGAMSL